MDEMRQRPVRLADDVSATLRATRKARGLYQFQAAKEFGVTEVSWSRYETGALPVPEDLLVVAALRWNAPQLLGAHPMVAAYRALSGDYDPRDPAPMAMAA